VLELPADDAAALKGPAGHSCWRTAIALSCLPGRPWSMSSGAVYNENSFVFKPEKRLTDYLSQAGGVALTGQSEGRVPPAGRWQREKQTAIGPG